MGIKTLFIAPYRGLKELAATLARQQDDLDIYIEEADLSAALPVVKAYEDKGVQFIISRGGTAKIISKYTNVPVVEIKLSGYDILRTLTLIKDYKMKVHMIGFPNICNDVLSIANLLHIDISYTVIQYKEEVADAVKEAWGNGAQLILGDTITVNTAESFGLQGMLITSGKEAIMEVFDQVRQMNKVMDQLEKDYSLYKEFLHHMDEGVLLFQESGEIHYANPVFPEKVYNRSIEMSELTIFDLPEEFVQLLPDVFQLQNRQILNKAMALQGEEFVVTGGKITNNSDNYFYFKLQEKKGTTAKSMEVIKDRIGRTSFAQLVTSSSSMKKVLQEAKEAAEGTEDVILFGEKGVGKRLIAACIHWESEQELGEFVEMKILDGSGNIVEEIAPILSSVKGTVYVTGFEKLTVDQQEEVRKLFSFLNEWRVIYSFPFHPDVAPNKLSGRFVAQMKGKTIYIPTLKERAEDLEELIRLYVANYNSYFGKQIVGIRKEALDRLRHMHWKENVEQLKRVVKELVSQSDGDYIEADLIDSFVTDEEKASSGAGRIIDLSKTLEEIEKEVILHVLQEENMNQTKAAKRLGINRTTLWRKIK
ncbi:transcriptional regulator with PAS, ATPase and Fis domain [Evansella vedderi]|uniref:Transcriptional regulator with PAS, ATPase and Fis domain n=1 Tax=Evansella vedderi TaxID=38282 RepID=A0ABT9ZP50_9BACI|nr:sigma-54-dependent transcriptional regulator [Evansella vedderi]MDQ0253020.1 transcriptional regulator with PAS, ATPase and Fis domain [Evansella vedderi]